MGVAMSLQRVVQIVSPMYAGIMVCAHASLPVLLAELLVLTGGAALSLGLNQILLKPSN